MALFDNIEGKSKFSKTQYDLSFREQWTKDLVEHIKVLHLNGYAHNTIVSALVNELGFLRSNARNLSVKVDNTIHCKGNERKKTMQQRNIIRLEHIYAICLQQGDITNALKTIDLLNKTCDVYKNNINIEQTAFTFQLGTNETVALPESVEPELIATEIIEENNDVDEK